MDADIGATIKADLGVHGGWENMRATPTLGNHIPLRTGLYMFVYRSQIDFVMADGTSHIPTWILYVGRAGSANSDRTLRDRYKSEYCKYIGGNLEQLWAAEKPRTRSELLQRYLSIWPLEYWWLVVEDRGKIESLEKRLIKLFSPPLNKQERLKANFGSVKPAFRTP